MSDEAIRRQLRRSAIVQLIEQVMKEEGVSLSDAVKVVYSSRLYGLIEDEATGLYREGPVYLYDMLCEERRGKGATNLPPGRRIEMPRRSSCVSG